MLWLSIPSNEEIQLFYTCQPLPASLPSQNPNNYQVFLFSQVPEILKKLFSTINIP